MSREIRNVPANWEHPKNETLASDDERYGPESERTWVQAYETVTLGTPVTPAFATEAQLIEHLVNVGMQHYRGPQKFSREGAAKFVEMRFLPTSMGFVGGPLFSGPALADELAKKKL